MDSLIFRAKWVKAVVNVECNLRVRVKWQNKLFWLKINNKYCSQVWLTATDIKEEPDTNSKRDSEATELSECPRTSLPTKSVISLMLLSMVLSINPCPTNTTTAEPAQSSTSTPELWESSSTNKSETESSPRDFISELSIWDFQPAERSSWTEYDKTTESRLKQTRRDKEFQLREWWDNQAPPSPLKSPTFNCSTLSYTSKSYDRYLNILI